MEGKGDLGELGGEETAEVIKRWRLDDHSAGRKEINEGGWQGIWFFSSYPCTGNLSCYCICLKCKQSPGRLQIIHK